MKVSTIGEWIAYADNRDDPRAEAVGELAYEIRMRLGLNKHVRVEVSEEVKRSQCCAACPALMELWMVIEYGDKETRIELDRGDDSEYLDWLDEPLKWARAANEKAVREHAAHVRTDAQLTAIGNAVTAVEAAGYASDGDWHDKVMDHLGVGGHRYRD
ncbi:MULTISPECIES: hypothetical protein [Nocardia]|uniref:hypothetical protein n=1 Tax=Nocardia TaxID=1817 RepID=UPI000D688FD1|nr:MULTISPECIES: hypothetical protein [Nocardia]